MTTEQPIEIQNTFKETTQVSKQQRFLMVGAKIFEVYEDTNDWKISPLP